MDNRELAIQKRCIGTLLRSLNIDVILTGFISQLRSFMEIDWSAIIHINQSEMTVMAVCPEENTRWKKGDKFTNSGDETGKLTGIRQMVIDKDLSAFTALDKNNPAESGAGSMMSIPLIVNSRVIGILLLAARQANPFTQYQINVLTEMADYLAYSVENSLRYSTVREEALIDGLTGLYNRRHLDDVLAKEITRHKRYGGVLSFVILDIDSMKQINDRFGHLYGDEVIKKTGKVINKVIRDSDYAFRFGGDEFVVLLPGTKLEFVTRIVNRIKARLSKVKVGDTGTITASFGFSCWPEDGKKANDIIKKADIMLYQNKHGYVLSHH